MNTTNYTHRRSIRRLLLSLCNTPLTGRLCSALLTGWLCTLLPVGQLCCGVAAAPAPSFFDTALSYRRFTTQDGLPQMQTETIWQDSRGYLYIGTLSGFVRYDGRELTPFLKGRRINIVGFQELDDRVYAFGFGRYWSFDALRPTLTLHHTDPAGERMLNNFNAVDLPPGFLLTEDGEEQQRMLCRLTAAGLQPLDDGAGPAVPAHLLDAMLPDRKLYIDSTGVYVPTPQGLYRVDPSGHEHLLTEQADVYSLCRWQGRLWAFAENGAFAIDGRETETRVRNLTSKIPYEGVSADYGLIVRPDRSGDLLIADAHSLYVLCSDGMLRQLATGFNLIKDLFVDRWDRVWLATYQGVYCFFNRRFTNHRLLDANDIVRAIAPLSDGHMVMGTLNGKLIAADCLLSDQPDDFFVPTSAVVDGKVYMACRGDVAVVEERGNNGGEAELSLRWLHLPYTRYQFVSEAGGRVILGTRQMVLSYDPATGTTDTLTTDIPHPWCATADGDGRLWVGSTYGLFCIDGDSVQKAAFGQQRLTVTTMAGDRRGIVYFAIGDSLLTVRHGQVEQLSDSLNALLSGHEVRQLHVSPRGYMVIAVIDGLFIVQLDAEGRVGKTAFFNHLNGFTMIEPQQARMAETEDGTVWMPCLEGLTSFRPDELLTDSQADTYIAPPVAWWQRWWVIALSLLALLLLVFALVLLSEQHRHRRRLRRLQREKKQKELQINAIRLKAIPHFHANVLAGIEYFLMNNDTAEATRYLKLYSDFTNQTLIDIDRPARTVAEEVAYTRIYLQLEQLRYGDRLHYDVSVGDDVNQEALLPTMLLHTYCQNAVKHGISSRPDGGSISLSISQRADGYIVVVVEDDGVGRAAAAHLNRHSTQQGLRILMEQIELYNQTNRRPIRQRVTDLADADGRPAGTRFEMAVPQDYTFDLL